MFKTEKVDNGYKRAVVFAHYDRHDMVDDYVFFYLKGLREIGSHIVFVSTARLSGEIVSRVKEYCDLVIIRENTGYDFLSYKIGLGNIDLSRFDEVIICNDSVYGPLGSIEKVFQLMRDRKCDFWGMTCGNEKSFHLQSYFIVFRREIIASPAFMQFWNNVSSEDNKKDVIEKCEISLTQFFIKKGFSAESFVKPSFWQYVALYFGALTKFRNYSKVAAAVSTLRSKKKNIAEITKNVNSNYISAFFSLYRIANPSHSFWKEFIRKGMPFIKVELLRDNPTDVNIKRWDSFLAANTLYDVALIKKHLERISGRNAAAGMREPA